MAGKDRNEKRALELYQALEAEPYRYDFNAALRAIDSVNPDRPRLGESVRPAEDAVRLGQEATLAFAPSQIARFTGPRGYNRARMAVYWLGMFGPNGILPTHLTEYARSRERNHDDPTFVRFVDLFHHRMLCFFHRAWANARPAVSYDRPLEDRFATYVASFIGLGEESLRDRDALPDYVRLNNAGHFARETRPPDGLMAIARQYFEVEVELQEFVGEWLTLPVESRWLLGRSLRTGCLGESATAGENVWTCQHKFRLVLGPMGYEDFQRFLPGKENLRRLHALVRSYCGDELAWELRLVLKKDQVPQLELGRQGHLGRTSWLNTQARNTDADDAVLQMAAA